MPMNAAPTWRHWLAVVISGAVGGLIGGSVVDLLLGGWCR
jgi:hypothetical protein